MDRSSRVSTSPDGFNLYGLITVLPAIFRPYNISVTTFHLVVGQQGQVLKGRARRQQLFEEAFEVAFANRVLNLGHDPSTAVATLLSKLMGYRVLAGVDRAVAVANKG